jgi:uncharacterized secreted repeat protein (TIGR03808 family)
MQDRRRFLGGLAAFLGGGSIASAAGRIDEIGTVRSATLRGSIDANDLGVYPAAFDDQSKAFARMLQTAAERNLPISLPPGDYVVSNITLPRHVRLIGVPGASRIVYGGDGHLFVAEDAEHVELNGLVLDGANRWMGDHVQAILDARRVSHLVVDNCVLNGSGKSAISLERVSGRIERSHISGAAEVAIYSAEAGQLQIVGNVVADCGNGGILVHRWQPGEDGTIITGNRVLRIHARRGGTGQYGNGINVFRAEGVVVSGNIVSDCAFSAIRANSASNVQIAGNRCSRSGETAIYSEFAFEGAVITSNIVDGAANGISVVNFNEGGRLAVCSNNLVRSLFTEGPYPGDSPGFGIGICVEADAAATGNVIEGAPTYGMLLGWGPFLRNVTATGNIIRQSPTGIAVSVVEGAGSAVIADNVISEAERGAVVGHRWAAPVTGDLARGGDAGFAHLTVERNRVS